MALVTVSRGARARAEIAYWHEAMNAYRAAFQFRPERDGSWSRWVDASQEYGMQAVTRFRGWRDLFDPACPAYAENQAYLGQRARVLASV